MIQEFIDRFLARKLEIEASLKEKHPEDYKELVRLVVSNITEKENDYSDFNPDPDKVHEINDGDYQGTLVYVIAAKDYQPSDYWYVKVGYGSCSGCDTLQAIQDYSDEPPTEEQVKQYSLLCLHIVEGLKKMGEDSV